MTGSSNPTPPMIEAGVRAFQKIYATSDWPPPGTVEAIYLAMHAARPNQEATRTVGDGELPGIALTLLTEYPDDVYLRSVADLRAALSANPNIGGD